jgi:hypothetical protein
MDALDLLRIQAIEKRDKAIHAARVEYRVAIQEINTLRRKLKLGAMGRPRLAKHVRKLGDINDSFHGMTAAAAALAILAEGNPMSLAELTLEVQRRGCRTDDDPHAVAHTLRGSLFYHRGKVKRDRDGRWVARTEGVKFLS